MRLVIWNCSQSLHRKAQQVLDLGPDIVIVPTAARQARTLVSKSTGSAWVGETPNRGLGVYSFAGYGLELHPAHDTRIQWVAPVLVKGPLPYFLLAVWALNGSASQAFADQRKRGQVRVALDAYGEAIASSGLPLVVAGDFSACPAWDTRERQDRHAGTVSALSALGLESAYHSARNVAFGEEAEPTVYDKVEAGHGFHTDVCFVPRAWAARRIEVTVGDYSPWVEEGWSDHVPLVVSVPESRPED